MNHKDQPYYSMDFIEEDGKTFVLFYDSQGELVAKREIPRQDIIEAIEMGEKN